jgi:hypothetical protein
MHNFIMVPMALGRGARPFAVLGLLLAALGLATLCRADEPAIDPNAPPAGAARQITGLFDARGKPINAAGGAQRSSNVGINDDLWVQIAPVGDPSPLDPVKFALYLNGVEAAGLRADRVDPKLHALVFPLTRTESSAALWTTLLGSPSAFHRPVSVSLGEKAAGAAAFQPTIQGDEQHSTFQFQVISLWRFVTAVIAVLLVVGLVWGHARNSTTLRDNLLPQVEANRQPYSLGRWQMAFWFTLIFTAFIFLFFLTWDYNTINVQALELMGISGATALASVAVDVEKNTPADDANRGLRALGLTNFADVLRVRQEITDRQAELAAGASLTSGAPLTAQRAKHLQTEIIDRQSVLRAYDDAIRPFVSEGWFNDITTDLNGSALHRLQVFCWTCVLGAVFVFGVYRNLAMPNFSNTLLALMAISSAGYVGFKFPEAQS